MSDRLPLPSSFASAIVSPSPARYVRPRAHRLRALLLVAAVLGLGGVCANAAPMTFTVTDTSDASANSLRAAITASNANDPGAGMANTINFNISGLPGTISLLSALPAINQSVTITGPGAYQLTVSGAGSYQVFNINSGTVTISGLTIANGLAPSNGYGGGIYNGGALTIANCTFSGNTASNTSQNLSSGGAIYTTGNLSVSGSTFVDDSASYGYGGAIFINSGTSKVVNSTFFANSAVSGGSGIWVQTGSTTVTNSTFSANPGGSAIFNADATLTVNNSIFAASNIINELVTNASNNVYDANSTCYQCTANSNPTSGNPDLLPLGYYGGTTQTILPQPGSAAICAGSSSLASSAGVTTDQRGFPLNSSCVDAGAVQTNYLTVRTASDTSGFLCPDVIGSACTLRGAITQANTDTMEDIDFLSSLDGQTIKLGTGGTDTSLPAITGQVNIIGPGANLLTVSGDNDTNVGSVFTVNSSATATIYGLTIADGNMSSNPGGGGINNSGALTVLASAISGNQARGGRNGGGVFSLGTMTLTGSTVSGNTASSGGGIFSGGTLTVTESTVSGNSAAATGAGGEGGGIFSGGTLTLAGSTVSGNSASCSGVFCSVAGGGIDIGSGTITAANSIVAGNTTQGVANSGDCGGSLGCPANGSNGNVVGVSNIQLSGLQYNGIGATVQTMIPLPGSPAICAGSTSLIPSGTTTDERGYPLQPTSGYCTSAEVDAGAVQTNYTSVAFVQQPSQTFLNTAISPAPTVEVLETDTLLSSNNTDAVGGVPVTLTPSGGTYSSGLTATTSSTSPFLATFSSLSSSTDASGIDLATNAITVTGSSSLASATSNTYDVITPVAPAITSANTAVFFYGQAGGFTVTTTGAPTPAISYTGFTTLPDIGLTFTDHGNGTATISGVVTANPGQSSFYTITARNGVSPNASQSFTLYSDFPIIFNPPATLNATVGVIATAQLSAFGGSNSFTYSISSPAPPSWVTLSPNGLLTAMPTGVSAPVTYTVTATDSLGGSASGTIQLIVNAAPVITTTSLPPAFVNVPYSTTITETGGSGPPTAWTLNPSVTGFSIDPTTGILSGTATSTGNLQFNITFTDMWGATTHKLLTLAVNNPPTYVVNTTTDDSTGTVSNCTPTEGTCTLRDALAAAAASGAGNITFSPTAFSTAQTISLTSNLALVVPAYTTITGPTTGSGSTLTNLVTVSGNNTTAVMVVNAGTTAVSFSNVNIEHGSFSGTAPLNAFVVTNGGSGYTSAPSATINDPTGTGATAIATVANGVVTGIYITNAGTGYTSPSITLTGGGGSGAAATLVLAGGVENYGSLTLTNVDVTNNASVAPGGGIVNAGTLTVSGGSISSNISSGVAGGIYNIGTVALTGTTLNANSTNGIAGAIYNVGGTLTLTNCTMSNNTAVGPSGAVYTTSPGTTAVNGGTFTGNSSSGGPGGALGADAATTLTVSGARFTNNTAIAPGGAIFAVGNSLTVSNSSFSNNSTESPGGAIYSNSPLNVFYSTFSGNSSTAGAPGGAIYSGAALTMAYSTVTGNSAAEGAGIFIGAPSTITNSTITGNTGIGSSSLGGGILAGSALTMNNSIVAGNSVTYEYADVFATSTLTGTGNLVNTGTGITSTINPQLGALQLNGSGSTLQTMLPLPGSPSICAGVASNIPAGDTTDERGEPNTNTSYISGTTCVDAGAVQTNYALNFTAQQPSSVIADQTMTPAPIVTVNESGNTFTAASATVSVTDSDSVLTSSPATASTTNGEATFGALQFNTAEATDSLTATLALNPALAPPLSITASSGTFSVTQIAQAISFSPASPVTYGVAPITLSATGGASGNPVTFSILSGSAYGSLSGANNSTLTVTGAGTIVIAANQAGNTDYSAAPQVMGSIVVNQAVLIVVANNATKTYGTANPTFTGSVSGQQYTDSFTESFSTSATLSSPVNTYSIVPSAVGTNLSDYTQSITDGTLTITKAASTTSLNLSSTTITPLQTVTFTATVASTTTGTPTGTVNFYDGTTLLNTTPVSLTADVAQYTTLLAPGITHTIVATYSGDTNFTGSSNTSTATVTVLPLDFTVTISGPSTQTVIPGSTITYKVTVTPDYGTYAGTVNFAVNGLPPGATVTFSPSSIAANGGPQTIIVTIQIASVTAALHAPPPSASRAAPFALAFLLLFGAGTMCKRGRALRRLLCIVALLVGGVAATSTLSGCGGNGFFAQAPENYSITLNVTAGNLEHSATFTLNVQ